MLKPNGTTFEYTSQRLYGHGAGNLPIAWARGVGMCLASHRSLGSWSIPVGERDGLAYPFAASAADLAALIEDTEATMAAPIIAAGLLSATVPGVATTTGTIGSILRVLGSADIQCDSAVTGQFSAPAYISAALSGDVTVTGSVTAPSYIEARIGEGSGPGTDEIAEAVWEYPAASVTNPAGMGDLLRDVPAAVWAGAVRTLTSVPGASTVLSVVGTGGAINLVRGDDHFAADGRSIQITRSTWPNLAGASAITLTVRSRETDAAWFFKADTVALRIVGAGAQTIVFEPTKTDTAALVPGKLTGKYDVQATLASGHVVTLEVTDLEPGRGGVNVYEDQTR